MRHFLDYTERDPGRIAVVTPEGDSHSYGELRDDAHRISWLTREHGVGSGATVATLLPNSYALLAVERGVTQLPLYLTPLNWHLASDEIAYVLRDSGTTLLFVSEPHVQLGRDAAAVAGLPPAAVVDLTADSHGLLGRAVAAQPADPPPGRSAGARMLYTSGTTGRPKGVRRPLTGGDAAQAAQGALVRASRFQADHEDGTFLAVAPMYHASPLAYAVQSLELGHTVVLLAGWNAADAAAAIVEHHVTWLYVVPLMMQDLLDLSEAQRGALADAGLRSLVHTAAPCPEHVKRAMIDWLGPILVEVYGGTEGSATVITSPEWLAHPGSVGRAVSGVSLRILDAHGAEVTTGQVGTVHFRNDAMDFVYLNDATKTTASRVDGHITLGDLGRLDEDGYLYLADRAADLIISGGVNIYPAEIEHALLRLDDVVDVCVVGRPNDRWGESVHATVVLGAGDAGAEAAERLTAELREAVAGFKIPRTWAFVDALPRSASGKLLRNVVRATIRAEG